MKTPALIAACLFAVPTFALADMKPVDASTAHAAFSGANYTCTLLKKEYEMQFADVPADAREFPYEIRTANQVTQDAYIVTDDGEIHLQSGDIIRYLAFSEDSLNIAKTSVGQAAVCLRE
ncbi:hypothetical protein shim_07860 [Shimia sp. SK013]|uniref:hypothetical protein n=1 Tax=Shimia sp. SK013 TaxID=1389006 RepID=UPI0006B407AE|nr:hypothetical protein [Shimia sp. SK013]KPA22502.1 hypothetical protein shim_07860 [Shimia sp. SK013]